MKASNPVRKRKLATRSGLEDSVIAALEKLKASFEYETLTIPYQKKPSKYTPDLVLENGIIVEVKGYFDAEDRAKHQLIKEQHPELDIRFVFQSSKKKLHKASPTTYADWATKHGFIYADKEIPNEWIDEGTSRAYREFVRTYLKSRPRKTVRKDTS